MAELLFCLSFPENMKMDYVDNYNTSLFCQGQIEIVMDRSSAISQLESILCKALEETLLNLRYWLDMDMSVLHCFKTLSKED